MLNAELAPEQSGKIAESCMALSRKLERRNLVVKEGDGLWREYNYVKGSEVTRRHFYRCMKCVNISKNETNKFSVYVTTLDGDVVRITGQHHPECKPKPEAALVAAEIDRAQRLAARNGFKSAKDAYTEGLSKIALYGENVAQYFPSWDRADAAYYEHAKK